MDVVLVPKTYVLRTPLRTAYGDVAERQTIELVLTAPDGVTGRGEAAPLESYDGVPIELVEQALARYVPILRDGDGRTGPELMEACRQVADLPQALAAVDLALWDAAGRRAGKPLAALLTDDAAEQVAVNATIGATDPETAASAASVAAEAGYACVKLKVGTGDDAARVAAVREAVGDDVAIRVDANGAWTVDEAVQRIAELEPLDPELIEEPVSGIEALRTVRGRVGVPIAMDETAAQHGAIASGATDLVCLKIASSGGISALLSQATLARAMGADVYVASSLDGPAGVAAALHCAAALRVQRACGLATLAMIGAGDPALAVHQGRIAVPSGPGLGLSA